MICGDFNGKERRGIRKRTAFPGGSVVKKQPVHAGDVKRWVQPPGQEDPLEQEMETHSSFLVWEIPWIEEPGGLQSMGLQRVRHDLATQQRQCVHMGD